MKHDGARIARKGGGEKLVKVRCGWWLELVQGEKGWRKGEAEKGLKNLTPPGQSGREAFLSVNQF